MIKPLANRILVKPFEEEEKTKGGLFLPDVIKEKQYKGEVVATGEGLKDEPMTIKVGDKVLYGKHTGVEITHDGCDYLLMRETDVFAII